MVKSTDTKKTSLAKAPLDELAAELIRRRSALPKLQARRDKLKEELLAVEEQIAFLGGITAPGTGKTGKKRGRKKVGRGRRRAGGLTLREKIGQILGPEPMRPIEIATTLVDKGLHPGGKSLQVQISRTLATSEEFSQLSRGQWVHKG